MVLSTFMVYRQKMFNVYTYFVGLYAKAKGSLLEKGRE